MLSTARLRLRPLTLDDAAFYLDLVNEPAYLTGIGDKGVRTLADAEAAITSGPMAMQAERGFSLHAVEVIADDAVVGLCGLIKRDTLDDIDLGYAFLFRYHGKGYAFEAAQAVLRHAVSDLRLGRVVAITSPTNERSTKLLERLGFGFERSIDWPDGKQVRLYGRSLAIPS